MYKLTQSILKQFLGFLKTNKLLIFTFLIGAACLLFQEPAMASLESSLMSIKSRLTGLVLPLVAVIGLVIATFSFITGNPNAKQHVLYALAGSAIGFGAQSIIDFINLSVH